MSRMKLVMSDGRLKGRGVRLWRSTMKKRGSVLSPSPWKNFRKEVFSMSNYSRDLLEMIVRHWTRGNRHTMALSLAGALRKLGWSLEETEELIKTVCSLAGDEETQDRLKAVRDTYEKGIDKIAGFILLPKEIADTLRDGGFSKSKVKGKKHNLEEIETICISANEYLLELIKKAKNEQFTELHRKFFRGLANSFEEAEEIVKKYGFGTLPPKLASKSEYEHLWGRLIIPYRNEKGHPIWFNARDFIGRQPRYLNAGGDRQTYRLPSDSKTVYIVEGEFNAITLKEAFERDPETGSVPYIIAISGNGVKPVIEFVKELKPEEILVIVDNDAQGRKYFREIQEAFKRTKRIILKDDRDLNEILMEEGFEGVWKALENAEEEAFSRIVSASEYRNVIVNLYKRQRQKRRYTTGYSFIDKDGLDNHLIVIGGAPGMGKTTLALNIALNLLESADDIVVYYVSYEIAVERLIAMLFRIFHNKKRYEEGKADMVSNLFALDDEELAKVLEENSDCMGAFERFLCFDAKGVNFKIDEILETITEDCPKNAQPVVFIDYLQLIHEDEGTAKEKIDSIVRKLMLLREEAPIIALSSINRQSYDNPRLDSLKESGSIEYSADRVFILTTDNKNDSNRTIEVRTLKNRYGALHTATLEHLGPYGLFIEK